MAIRTTRIASAAVILLLASSGLGHAQESATIWRMLGIPQTLDRLNSNRVNRRGNRPQAERKPPLKRLADPANLESKWEPIKVAAEVKQAEDAAPQKIKAVKYLAKIGCGCYDKKMEGKLTEALVAAMDDCTEDVRKATVKAIGKVACGEVCTQCGAKKCCNDKILAQLVKLAYERDETGCYVEPSEDVREAAIEALECCCSNENELIIDSAMPPIIDPEGDLEPPPTPEPPPVTTEARLQGVPVPVRAHRPHTNSPVESHPIGSHRVSPIRQESPVGRARLPYSEQAPVPPQQMPLTRQVPTVPTQSPANLVPSKPPVLRPVGGRVENVDRARDTIQIVLDQGATLQPGSEVEASHQFLMGRSTVATLRVVASYPGMATARPLVPGLARKIARGDTIKGWGNPAPGSDEIDDAHNQQLTRAAVVGSDARPEPHTTPRVQTPRSEPQVAETHVHKRVRRPTPGNAAARTKARLAAKRTQQTPAAGSPQPAEPRVLATDKRPMRTTTRKPIARRSLQAHAKPAVPTPKPKSGVEADFINAVLK